MESDVDGSWVGVLVGQHVSQTCKHQHTRQLRCCLLVAIHPLMPCSLTCRSPPTAGIPPSTPPVLRCFHPCCLTAATQYTGWCCLSHAFSAPPALHSLASCCMAAAAHSGPLVMLLVRLSPHPSSAALPCIPLLPACLQPLTLAAPAASLTAPSPSAPASGVVSPPGHPCW